MRKLVLLALIATGCDKCPEHVQPEQVHACGLVCGARGVALANASECRCQEIKPDRVEVLP